MAISHKDHDHPNTPAARGVCRRWMLLATTHQTQENVSGDRKPAKLMVVPRKRGDGGVVKGMKDAAPKNLKRTNTLIKADYDLADVPRMLAYGVRMAWAADWDVRVGDPFNDNEARIVIEGDRGTISLVWSVRRPNGLWAIWIKNYDNSKQWKVESVQEAMELMNHDSNRWDEFGNLINA